MPQHIWLRHSPGLEGRILISFWLCVPTSWCRHLSPASFILQIQGLQFIGVTKRKPASTSIIWRRKQNPRKFDAEQNREVVIANHRHLIHIKYWCYSHNPQIWAHKRMKPSLSSRDRDLQTTSRSAWWMLLCNDQETVHFYAIQKAERWAVQEPTRQIQLRAPSSLSEGFMMVPTFVGMGGGNTTSSQLMAAEVLSELLLGPTWDSPWATAASSKLALLFLHDND